MPTLAPPNLTWPEPSMPSCEQTLPGNANPDEQEGKLGGGGVEPQPLQGGTDASESGDREKETGSEGDGP